MHVAPCFWMAVTMRSVLPVPTGMTVQPILSMATQGISGPAVEILIRLPDERGRIRNSAEFLQPVTRYQLMPQIDRWVVSPTLARLSAISELESSKWKLDLSSASDCTARP